MRRAASVGIIALAALFGMGATPALAQVEQRGLNTRTFYTNGQYHLISAYFNVDYTNHRIRAYARSQTPYSTGIYLTNNLQYRINGNYAGNGYGAGYGNVVTSGALINCPGYGRRYLSQGNPFSFQDGPDINHNSYDVDTAC